MRGADHRGVLVDEKHRHAVGGLDGAHAPRTRCDCRIAFARIARLIESITRVPCTCRSQAGSPGNNSRSSASTVLRVVMTARTLAGAGQSVE
jgi:hypothetical protein